VSGFLVLAELTKNIATQTAHPAPLFRARGATQHFVRNCFAHHLIDLAPTPTIDPRHRQLPRCKTPEAPACSYACRNSDTVMPLPRPEENPYASYNFMI